MKNPLLTLIFLLISSALLAQNTVAKWDVIIHLTGSNAWGERRYSVDIYKKGRSAKIVYTYRDTLSRSAVKNDSDYKRTYGTLKKYKADDTRRKLLVDTIRTIIKRYEIYTSDSITLNLKKDTAYKNLLQKMATASKKELVPNKPRAVLDGNGFALSIITAEDKKEIFTDDADLTTYPILVDFIIKTLDKAKNSSTVLKIHKYYLEYNLASYH